MIKAVSSIRIVCDACELPVTEYGTIRLTTYNPRRRYQASRRKMISNYRWRLCIKHYNQTLKTIINSVAKI